MRRSPTAISERGHPDSAAHTLAPAQPGTEPRNRAKILGGLRPLLLCSRQLGADPGPALPKPSLPVRLALLVAGTTLPLIIFAAGIVFNNYEQDRKDATQRVLETVRSIRLVLDAEMQRMTGGTPGAGADQRAARTATSTSFRRIASGFLDQYGKDGVVLVADREGRQLFSSVDARHRQPAAAQQPRHRREGVRDQAARTTQTCSSARSRSG